MIGNKFFNDSTTTTSGKPKFLPPQKRQLLKIDDETSNQQPSPIEKPIIQQTSNIRKPSLNQEERKPCAFSFKRNCKSLLTAWGSRHSRTGYLDKTKEMEEEELIHEQKKQEKDNVENYDKLKVDVFDQNQHNVLEGQEKFEDLMLNPCLLANIHQLGYTRLTIIQRHVVPVIQKRINVMACSQTGSGKTASFLIPIIQDLLQTGPPSKDISAKEFERNRRAYPIALIIAPTRELALQIYCESRKVINVSALSEVNKVIYGGKDSFEQQRSLTDEGCDILIATPGRLIDFMNRFVDFRFLRYIVLDEADRMLDMGFEPQIRDIIAKCKEENFHKDEIHMSMFSATFPKQVKNLAEEYLQDYIYIAVGNQGKSGSINDCIKQELVDVQNQSKNLALFQLISQIEVSNVYNYLSSKNLFVSQIHGDLTQKEREGELHLFKDKCSIMIATDVASRGLDIPDVACVINYDLPTNVEGYIHRIGRTGRIGKIGKAISFIDANDEPMFKKLYNLLRDSKQEIPKWFQTIVEDYREDKGKPSNQYRPKKNYSYTKRDQHQYRQHQYTTQENRSNFKKNPQSSVENQENRNNWNIQSHEDE